jgi:hypothetical protein
VSHLIVQEFTTHVELFLRERQILLGLFSAHQFSDSYPMIQDPLTEHKFTYCFFLSTLYWHTPKQPHFIMSHSHFQGMFPCLETLRSQHTHSQKSFLQVGKYSSHIRNVKLGNELHLTPASTPLVTLGKEQKEYVTVRVRNLN